MRATAPVRKATTKPAIKPARGHREQIEPGHEETDRGSWQDGMRHGVADQAHAAQHQEHPDRAGTERQRQRACQGHGA